MSDSSSSPTQRALAALLGGEEPPDDALADPVALIPVVDAARRAWLERGRPPQLSRLPPCLDIALRPSEPLVPLPQVPASLPPPCDDCSHALWCPANAAPPRGDRTGLRPLRHREPAGAVLAALRSIYAAWGQPDDATVVGWIHDQLALRRGMLGVSASPLELSLKREGDRLAPLLRVVDLHPPLPPSPAMLAASAHRRSRVCEHASGLGSSAAAAAIHELVALVDAHQPDPGWGLSYGIEAPIHGGPLRTQLYAHVSTDDTAAVRALVRAALRWAGAAEPEVARFTAFTDPRPVALVTHAPQPDDPRSIKIYVVASLDDSDPASGLRPLARPAHAPRQGLAVLRCDARGVGWEKWDFRCAPQFQATGPVFDDFVAGLRDGDAERARRIVDGTSFVPWPTWVSVRPDARTIYFHPR